MGNVHETIKTVNSTLRTILTCVLVGAAGWGGYLAYDLYNQPQKKLAEKEAELTQVNNDLAARKKDIIDLNLKLDETARQVERLEVAMRLLKVRRRLARLTVLDQHEVPPPAGSPAGAQPEILSKIDFVEINEEGNPIGQPKQFDIKGDLVYIDYLRVSFDDRYVEESDLDRSTAICLFQRIFGEHQQAAEGYQLDHVGTRPTAYARGTDMSDFERKIWDDFWTIANNPQKAAELGIHAAHGSAVSMRVQPGKTYEVDLRATGDMTIRPVESKAGTHSP